MKRERRQAQSLIRGSDSVDAVDSLSSPRKTKAEALAVTPPISALSVTTSSPSMDIDFKTETDIKLEDMASPSQSPTLVADISAQKLKMSRSPTQSAMEDDGATSSKSSTPPVTVQAKTPRKAAAAPVQLIGDLPIASEDALASFHEIHDNNYQYKSLGRSREILESMTCDCTYEHGVDNEDNACGPYSDCINRLTQVECLPDDCRCRKHCQNQRFQQKQYANIDIVLTEKKGYGLRAEEDLPTDAFIYEYVGDVVNPVSFKKRMREYAEEGIRHFYFMMLQKDEFIDATKSGGIGRFANHSCNPNCYVAKWTIGTQVRMGIFAKRNIKKHEELTFNYNVDRYGHQAQECFCGEPMCVGYIGGKTQTDIATMDDLYLDALGITDEDDLMELKGTKKKKGKKIDDPDFMPTLKAITEKDVPKVVQAIRQTTSRKVLFKLLTRLKMTEDQAALRQIMRLRGYSLMTNVLDDYPDDMEMIALALECMSTWPLLNKNKVQDSKVHVPVEACTALDNETIKTLAQKLLDHWNTLPVYNRIPKRQIHDEDILAVTAPTKPPPPKNPWQSYASQVDTTRYIPREVYIPTPKVYKRPRRYEEPLLYRRYSPPPPLVPVLLTKPVDAGVEIEPGIVVPKGMFVKERAAKDIIASAVQAAEEAAATAAAEAKAKADAAEAKAARRKARAARKAMAPQDKEALKEKRLLKLVGAVVVKCMSKYSKSFDRDGFKKYAKELTQLIADKEKKSSSYREGRLETLSEEKAAKIKKFAKEYIAKVVRKLEKSGKRPKPAAEDTPSTSMQTPNSHDGGDVQMADTSMPMSVEEAMGIDGDSDSEDDADGDIDEDVVEEGGEFSAQASMSSLPSAPQWPNSQWSEDGDPSDEPMEMDGAVQSRLHPDPRLRPPMHI